MIAIDLTPVRLMELAEAANPPEKMADENNWWREVEFKTPDGWAVWFFYDGECLDYIDRVVAPDGTVINPWKTEFDGTPMRDAVFWWRSVGDLDRLKEHFT